MIKEVNMSTRQECIKNCKSVANMELYQKIADFGNDKLGHIWDFTVDDILRVMHAATLYCIENGEKRDVVDGDIMLRSLRWTEADGAIIIMTHTI